MGPYPKMILLVDDEPALREVLGAFLRDEGFDVMEAANGHEAMAVLQSFRPSALVIDLMMPGMNGWELLDALDGSPALQGIPRLVLTACVADPAIHQRALGVFEKPFDVDELAFALERAVDRRLPYRRQAAPT